MMTEKKRQTKLAKTFQRYQSGLQGAFKALESRHKKIAEGVLDQLDQTRGQIDSLISEGNYAPSVSYDIKKLQQQQRSNAEAFAAAIKIGDIKATKQVKRFMIDTDDKLTDLLRIEAA